MQVSSWRRKIGMLLAALVLSVLAFGPGLDGLLCRDAGSLSAAATEMRTSVAAADSGIPVGPESRAGVCFFGHCHHATPYIPAPAAAASLPTNLTSIAHPIVRTKVLTSDPKFSFIRPPRA